MGTPHQQFIDINDCVNAYLDESEQNIHKHFKVSQLAFRAMDEMGIDFFYQIKSVKLPVNSNYTVTLPPGYLNYSKIGVLNSVGEVITLNLDSKLTTYADLLPTRLQQTQDNTLFNWNSQANGGLFFNYWDGSTLGNLYGLPSGAPFVGTFKVDNHNGVILLGENFQYSYIILEFLSSPVDGQTYMVPIQFKEAIISYVRWKDIISLPQGRKSNMGMINQRKRDYYNDRRIAIARYKPFRVQEAYQINLENQRLTIKA